MFKYLSPEVNQFLRPISRLFGVALKGDDTEEPTKQLKQLHKIQHLREEYRARRLVRRYNAQDSWVSWLSKKLHYSRISAYSRSILTSKRNIYRLLCADLIADVYVCVLAICAIELGNPIAGTLLVDKPAWLWISLNVLSFFNLISFIVRIFFSRHPFTGRFATIFLIDCMTTYPQIASMFITNGRDIPIPNFLRAWVVVQRLQILLALRLEISANGSSPYDLLTVKIIRVLTNMGALIFSSTCAFQLAEMLFARIDHTTFNSLYFIVITFSTLGYGDIAPKSTIARIVIIFALVFAISFLPKALKDLAETFQTRQRGYLSYIADPDIPFVVIYVSHTRDVFLEDIIQTAVNSLSKPDAQMQDIFMPSPKTKLKNSSILSEYEELNSAARQKYHIVLMSSTHPSPHIQNLLKTQPYRSNITWIRGSPLEDNDLRRCSLEKAAACFMLADRGKNMHQSDAKDEDHSNVLRVWSVRRYAPATPVFVYNLRPESDVHVKPVSRQVICISSLKQMIMAFGALHEGSLTLITNLIHKIPNLQQYQKSWQIAYADGMQNDIVFGPFNPLFEEKLFCDLAWFLYAEFQVVLIGIHYKVPARVRGGVRPMFTYKDHYVLNPGANYVIPCKALVDKLVFIAHSRTDIKDISSLNASQFEKAWIKWHGVPSTKANPPTAENDLASMFHNSEEKDTVSGTLAPRQAPILGEYILPNEATKAHSPEMKPFLSAEDHGSHFKKSALPEEVKQIHGSPLKKDIREDAVPVKSLTRHRTPSNAVSPFLHTRHQSKTHLSHDSMSAIHFNMNTDQEIVLAHPVPPHHMILDRDLQTPYCHLWRYPVSLEDVLLTDVNMNDSDSMNSVDPEQSMHKSMKLLNHVIICSGDFEIWSFMCTMRASFLDKSELKPVVILCSIVPTQTEWKSLSVFPHLYIVRGSALRRKDIIRAGLYDASCVIMMRHLSGIPKAIELEERLHDSAPIMATHQIDFMMGEKYVITELSTKNNIKFLRAKFEMLDHLPTFHYNIQQCPIRPLEISQNYRSMDPDDLADGDEGKPLKADDNDIDILRYYSHNANSFKKANTSDPAFFAYVLEFLLRGLTENIGTLPFMHPDECWLAICLTRYCLNLFELPGLSILLRNYAASD
eukprot:Partr_v1_DN28629_c0_g1_i1_m50443 putative Potassium large conductance calcium-activated channel, subfamily M, alpha member 1